MTTQNILTRVTIAPGDGIGPEIMDATLKILEAAGAVLEQERVEVGLNAYQKGLTSGIGDDAWESLARTKILLKGPISTPQGGGMKSLNVTLRKTLGLFANVRPCRAFTPYVASQHPEMDLVVVRENEEDLYAGIEHRQTDEVYQCLKLITRPGSERIVRYAFEYARAHGRKKVTCLTKDNIMKLTDGLFHKVFDELGAEYPDIEKEHMIIDIGTALVAERPERFDVIVTPNLYGDILSDVTSQISGSVGLGASANIGEACSMFEAIHGSAPDIAGKNIANPSGLLLAACYMLVHMGQSETATKVANAWMCAIEDGMHTGDIYKTGISKQKLSTSEFAQAVIERLGSQPKELRSMDFKAPTAPVPFDTKNAKPAVKKLDGIDIFVHCRDRNPDALAEVLQKAEAKDGFTLQMITNRGVKVWPKGHPNTFCTDHWRCRFVYNGPDGATQKEIWNLALAISELGTEVIKTENLYSFDGERGYSLGQGQ